MKIKQETSISGGVQNEEAKQNVRNILRDDIQIHTGSSASGNRSLSQPIQDAFQSNGHRTEVSPQSLPNKRVDVYHGNIPIEIDIGSKRTAVLTNLLTLQEEYSQGYIDESILIVPENKEDWGGKSWFKTREWAKKEISKYESVFDIPIWLVGVSP
ncbi:BglII/BstYI family type II restriction endonuclease [Halorubrum sp. Ea8]|uniref:BglII/BstYI family type II restriction endonuclease n=1 Tax=Halorubrum sp. Ea8 TaxID=1383841 RepID=UPI000B990CB8|nr:BglII/BstYI family type II restriction endonuclease [Halorubrum sp. Ea8]OYR50046.1 hypothetical protein DJ74_06760 [Halorubrum sp. Ea8]